MAAALSGSVANIVLGVVLGVWLNNLFALRRDREVRVWGLRQQHLARLQPILRADAERLDQLAKTMSAEGYLLNLTDTSAPGVQQREHDFWEADILSNDLREHFRSYFDAKQSLRTAVRSQDQQFWETMRSVEKNGRLQKYPSRVREVSVAVLDKCMGHGSGLRLIVNESGFNYISHGGALGGGSGKPSQDVVAAFSAFNSFRPSADLLKTCATLAQHADQLATRTQQLSTEAKALAEQTTLEGSCQFVRLNQND